MFLFLLCSNSFIPPRGSNPDTWEKYRNAIDIEKNIFHCFSSNKTIDLKKVNDNYLDCEDGSDEPGTSASQKGYFYCQNAGDTPKLIPFWSVGDGICDCCDGSDEIGNSHVKCKNVCKAPLVQNENKTQIFENELLANRTTIHQHKTSFWKIFFISFCNIY